MKMNFKLDMDYRKWLPVLQQLQPYIFGLALVAVFAYTSVIVNAALDVKASATPTAVVDPAAKIKFDRPTIEAVKKLEVVQGTVPTGDLGKSDPFR